MPTMEEIINAMDIEKLKETYLRGYAYAGGVGKPTDRKLDWFKGMIEGMMTKTQNLTEDAINKFVFFNSEFISKTGRTAKTYGYGAVSKFDFNKEMPSEEMINQQIEANAVPEEPVPETSVNDANPEGTGQPSAPVLQAPKPLEIGGKKMTHMESIFMLMKQASEDRKEYLLAKIRAEQEAKEKERELAKKKYEERMAALAVTQGTLDSLHGEYHCNGWRRIRAHNQASRLMLADEIVALYGPRGTGKTEYVINLCKDLGWQTPFITTAPMFKTDLTGYNDAMGKYNSTPFVDGFQADADHPCIVLIEEIDRASPEALIALNSAMANGVMDTPIGNIFKGEGCHIMCTANTNGNGGSAEYNTANELDASTIDRMKWIYCGYDPDVIRTICETNDDLYEFALDCLNAISKLNNPRGIGMTYRTVRDILHVENIFEFSGEENSTVKTLDCAMTKGASEPSICALFDALEKKENKYAIALNSIPKVMGKNGGY